LGHQILENEQGLFLFRNGVKLTLREGKDKKIKFLSAGFVNEDVTYYAYQEAGASYVVLYDGLEKRDVFQQKIVGAMEAVKARQVKHNIFVSSKEGFAILDQRKWRQVIPWTAGQSLQITPDQKSIQYRARNPQSRRWETVQVYY